MRFFSYKNKFLYLTIALIISGSLSLTTLAPVAAAPPPQAPLNQYVQSSDGRVSLRLPDSWVYTDVVATENIIAFGETDAAMVGRLNDLRGEPGLLISNGGTITLFNVADYGLTETSVDVLQTVMDSGIAAVTEEPGGDVLEEPQVVEINPGQEIVLAVITSAGERGYAAMLGFGDTLAIMTATSTPTSWEANRDLLYSIIQSVRIPAEEGAVTPPDNTTTSGTIDEGTLVRATDGSLSVVVPTGWSFRDELVENEIFVFGENEAEAENRSVFWVSNELVEVAGAGGLISLRTFEAFGVDPATFDIETTMNNFIRNLELEAIEPIQIMDTSSNPGAHAVIDWGNQRGYVGLIAYGTLMAIIYISDTPSNFQNSRDILLSVLKSIRLPAEIAAPPTAGGTAVPTPSNPTNNGGTGLGGALGSAGDKGDSSVPLPLALRNEANTFEILLPEGWQTLVEPSTIEGTAGSETFYFANSLDEINTLRSSQPPTSAGGLIFLSSRSTIDFAGTMTMEELFTAFDPGDQLGGKGENQSGTINGFEAMWFEFNATSPNRVQGFWVVIALDDSIALIVLRTVPEAWEADGPVLEAIFKSVRYNADGLTGIGDTGGLGDLDVTVTPAPLRPSGATPTATPPASTPTRLPASPTPTTGSQPIQATPGGPTPTPTLGSVG